MNICTLRSSRFFLHNHYNQALFCFSRDQANAAAAERSAVEIKLLQDRVGRYHVFGFGDFKTKFYIMVNFQEYTK